MRAAVVQRLPHGDDGRGQEPQATHPRIRLPTSGSTPKIEKKLRRVGEPDHTQQLAHVGPRFRLRPHARAEQISDAGPHHPARQRRRRSRAPARPAPGSARPPTRAARLARITIVSACVLARGSRLDVFVGGRVELQDPDEAVGQRHGRDHGTIGSRGRGITPRASAFFARISHHRRRRTRIARGRGTAQAAAGGLRRADPAAQRGRVPASPARDRGGGGAAAGDSVGAAAVSRLHPQARDAGRRRSAAPGFGGAGAGARVAGGRDRGRARRRAADGLGGSDRPHRGGGRPARRGPGGTAGHRHGEAGHRRGRGGGDRAARFRSISPRPRRRFRRRCCATRCRAGWTPPTRRRWSSAPAYPCTWSKATPAT